MRDYALGTIYTTVTDSWDTLYARSGLGKDQLIELNPHLADIPEIEPGIPIDIPYAARRGQILALAAKKLVAKSPYEFAKDELLLNIGEVPGASDHARIVLYHSTTNGGAAPDEVAWCSSFVNFCVEQAGLTGTDSKAARSWKNWGKAVPKTDWRVGDIVVFWRTAPTHWQGHVGFLVDWSGSRPHVLGGDTGNRLSIATPYPYSRILSVRRPS